MYTILVPMYWIHLYKNSTSNNDKNINFVISVLQYLVMWPIPVPFRIQHKWASPVILALCVTISRNLWRVILIQTKFLIARKVSHQSWLCTSAMAHSQAHFLVLRASKWGQFRYCCWYLSKGGEVVEYFGLMELRFCILLTSSFLFFTPLSSHPHFTVILITVLGQHQTTAVSSHYSPVSGSSKPD